MAPRNQPPLTYDSLLAAGDFRGREADLYRAAAEYLLDGARLGGIEIETVTDSLHDGRFTPKRAEVETVAYILARLGYTEAELKTVDAAGAPLERPDLDVLVGSECWGFEVARGIEPARARADAEEERIVMSIRDLLDGDAEFQRAFGAVSLFVRLESDQQPLSRSIGKKIISELIQFVRAGNHLKKHATGAFGPSYPVLSSRGASFDARRPGPAHFSVTHGTGTVDQRDRTITVLQTLDQHRKSAATYRHARNWFAIHITDWFDLFRPTLSHISARPPQIAPFERAFVMSISRRIVDLDARSGTVISQDVPY